MGSTFSKSVRRYNFHYPIFGSFGHETGPGARSGAETLGIRSPRPRGHFPTPPRLPRVKNLDFSRIPPPRIQPQVVTGSMVLWGGVGRDEPAFVAGVGKRLGARVGGMGRQPGLFYGSYASGSSPLRLL